MLGGCTVVRSRGVSALISFDHCLAQSLDSLELLGAVRNLSSGPVCLSRSLL
ncbi:hypothetical protein SynRS9907_02012 [Synechococcus sp. RS9907]|nr:hypothetical protein SynRS9907_02012 [Synechococcus sp. RS9907]